MNKVSVDLQELETDKGEQQETEKIDTNQETKRALNRLMSYFIMSLKIPCYGKIPKKGADKSNNISSITNFYYYDILEALARDVFLRWI